MPADFRRVMRLPKPLAAWPSLSCSCLVAVAAFESIFGYRPHRDLAYLLRQGKGAELVMYEGARVLRKSEAGLDAARLDLADIGR